MRLKRLILILLGLATRIALLGQSDIKLCDSAVSVCPHVFDYLISQDVKAQGCAVENINFRAEIHNLEFQLKETKSVLQTTSDILLTTNQEKELMRESIILKDRAIKKQSRKIAGLKIGCVAIGTLGAATSIYLFFR